MLKVRNLTCVSKGESRQQNGSCCSRLGITGGASLASVGGIANSVSAECLLIITTHGRTNMTGRQPGLCVVFFLIDMSRLATGEYYCQRGIELTRSTKMCVHQNSCDVTGVAL